MSKHHIVYVTTNLLNFKVYVGIHSTDNLDDGYLGSGKELRAAVKQYGKHNFTRNTLYVGSSRADIIAVEAYYVNSEFVRDPSTYNLSLGGVVGPVLVGQLNPASSSRMPEEKRKEKARKAIETRRLNGNIRTGEDCNFSAAVLSSEELSAKAKKAVATRKANGSHVNTINAMQEAKRNNAQLYIFVSPEGVVHEVPYNVINFCKDNGISHACIHDRIFTDRFGVVEPSKYHPKVISPLLAATIGWAIYKKEDFINEEKSHEA